MTAWWKCPNDPPCAHGAALHDVEDFSDERPTCCAEGCDCGQQPAGQAESECPKSRRVDGLLHSWVFDGDDPRIVCAFCNEMRDALSGAVLREGRRG